MCTDRNVVADSDRIMGEPASLDHVRHKQCKLPDDTVLADLIKR